MRQYLAIDVLANWISMIRASTVGAIWLPDDDQEARFYDRCAHAASRVVPANGVAPDLLQLVSDRGVRGVIAVVRKLEADSSVQDGLFRPGAGDVASILLLSSVYEDVIRDVAGAPWFTASRELIGDLRCRALAIARTFGRTRARQPQLSFDQLTSTVDWAQIRANPDALKQLCDGWLPEGAQDTWPAPSGDLFREALIETDGMHVLEVIAAAITHHHPHGIQAARSISAPELMSLLRVSFRLEELESDDIFWLMRAWERLNPTYPLLRVWRLLDPLGTVLDQRYWEGDLAVFLFALKDDEEMGIAKMDLDNFKSVNETLGHTGGDEAIRVYCNIVRTIFGATGEVYRRGGDEVLALVPTVKPGQLEALCEDVRREIEQRFQQWCGERSVPGTITTSIGAAVVRRGSLLPDVVTRLDRAQLEAKRLGKNRVVVDVV